MAKQTFGAACLEIISEMRSQLGPDAEITAEEAKRLFGREEACVLDDLTEVDVLQLALLEAYALIFELRDQQDKRPAPNRAARRKK